MKYGVNIEITATVPFSTLDPEEVRNNLMDYLQETLEFPMTFLDVQVTDEEH